MKSMSVDVGVLPPGFPTHQHDGAFWEGLGRAVATFGFLEEMLGKAIISFTATKPYEPEEIEEAYRQWLPRLERALTDALGALVREFERTVREHPSTHVAEVDELLSDLREAARIRNVLCHGSWRPPDVAGASSGAATCSRRRLTAPIWTACSATWRCLYAR